MPIVKPVLLGFVCALVFGAVARSDPAGLRQNPQSGSYVATAGDCGGRIVFDVTAQATLTFGAASQYPNDCDITVSNVGRYTGPGTARGVVLAIDRLEMPNQGNVLYPGQTTVFSKVESKWVETGYGQRQLWKPDNRVTFFVDCDAGSDKVSDGLGPGPGANRTLGHGFIRLSHFIDYSGGASQARWSTTGQCAPGDVLHMAGPLRGGEGHAAFVWNGNGTTIVNAVPGGPCAALFDNAVAEIVNLTCRAENGNACFGADSGAKLYFITTPSTCSPGVGSGFTVSGPGSTIEFFNVGFNFGSPGVATAPVSMFSAQNGGIVIFDTPQTITFLGDVAFSQAGLVAYELGGILLAGTKFNTAGHTVSGLRFLCEKFSVLRGLGGSPNTTLPGNQDGIIGPDCRAF